MARLSGLLEVKAYLRMVLTEFPGPGLIEEQGRAIRSLAVDLSLSQRLWVAILALGDSTYEQFCGAGQRLDRRFEELGTRHVEDRIDCDDDHEGADLARIDHALTHCAPGPGEPGHKAPAAAALDRVVPVPRPPPAAAVQFDEEHPLPAPVLDNLALTGRDSSKETSHVELSLEGAGLTHEPGDASSLQGRNDPAVVAAKLDYLTLSAAAPASAKGGYTSLGGALEAAHEINQAMPGFVEQWARSNGVSMLRSAPVLTPSSITTPASVGTSILLPILPSAPVMCQW